MLDSTHPQTLASLKRLALALQNPAKPVVVWLGAGTSRWAGLPAWKDLARAIHRDFRRCISAYQSMEAKVALDAADFPLVFQLCREADPGFYNQRLSEMLGSKEVTPLFSRFIGKLSKLDRLLLITTNVDQLIEQLVPSISIVENTDLDRFSSFCRQGTSSIAKLHGSLSSLESLVFTSDQYRELEANQTFVDNLKLVLETTSVVFFGYGLRDDYVLRILRKHAASRHLFGPGPHFFLSADGKVPEDSLFPIRYNTATQPDHSGAMAVLDYIQQCQSPRAAVVEESSVSLDKSDSALLIVDLLTPGENRTSETAKIEGGRLITTGLGWIDAEQPAAPMNAMHDFLVGLLCFDKTYVPLRTLPGFHNALGDELFFALLASEAIRFFQTSEEPAIIAPEGSAIGALVCARIFSEEDGPLRTLENQLRRMVKPSPKDPSMFHQSFDRISRNTVLLSPSEPPIVPDLSRNALLMPNVWRSLGFGEAVLPSQVPLWLRFPMLRLAAIVQAAQVCRDLKIRAAKLPFGGTTLVSAGFGVSSAERLADHYASYVLTGQHRTNLGVYLVRNPKMLLKILSFRDRQAGVNLRSEIKRVLDTNANNDFPAAVDAGIREALSFEVLDRARADMDALLLADGLATATPVVWSSDASPERSMRIWREAARANFLATLREMGKNTGSECLCGSGFQARICCLLPLQH